MKIIDECTQAINESLSYLLHSRGRLDICWWRNRRCRRRQRWRRRAAAIRRCTDYGTVWATAVIRFRGYHVSLWKGDWRCWRCCRGDCLHLLGNGGYWCRMGRCHGVGSIVFGVVIFWIEPNFFFLFQLTGITSVSCGSQYWGDTRAQTNWLAFQDSSFVCVYFTCLVLMSIVLFRLFYLAVDHIVA
jgi:hypothetical protein